MTQFEGTGWEGKSLVVSLRTAPRTVTRPVIALAYTYVSSVYRDCQFHAAVQRSIPENDDSVTNHAIPP